MEMSAIFLTVRVGLSPKGSADINIWEYQCEYQNAYDAVKIEHTRQNTLEDN